MIKTKDRVKDIRRRMSNDYIFDEPGEMVVGMYEDMEWALGAIESLIEESEPFRAQIEQRKTYRVTGE